MKERRTIIGSVVAGIVVLAFGWLTHPVFTVFAVSSLLLLVVAVVRDRRGKSAALVGRWKARSDKNKGLASPWMVFRSCSWWTLRRRVKVLKPSVKYSPFWVRWRVPINELGAPIIKVGGLRMWSSNEEHSLSIGGPRSGKSKKVSDLALSASGATLITTTGWDLHDDTAAVRAKLGPVVAFNPAGIGGVSSTIDFDVLAGCEDAVVATERATDLISGTPLSDTKKDPEWVGIANSALAGMMHAAALSGKTMQHVQRWVAAPVDSAPEIMRYLTLSPYPSVRLEVGQFLSNDRNREGICLLMMSALRWLSNPSAVACTRRTGAIDVAKFLEQRGSIYLIAKNDGTVTPLITAFAGFILREVRTIAEHSKSARLDPEFTIVLDEAPISCPLIVPKLLADMGKFNIVFHVVAQSFSQLCDRWGEQGAGAILTNCATIIAFGGTKDPAGLSILTTLIGRHGGGEVLTAAQIQQLPVLHAVVFRNGILPVVGVPQLVFHRGDFRTAKRAEAAADRAVRWAPRWCVVRGLVRSLGWRRRAVAPVKPMLALTAGRSDSLQPGWQPGLVESGSDLK